MRKKKKKIYLGLSLLILVIILIFGILFYINNSKNNYSFKEKSWINSNNNKFIDVSVQSDLPIFSYNGEGVFYDFLTDMQDDTGLSYNITVNNNDAKYKLINKNTLSLDDIVFYTDHYVVVGKKSDPIELNGLKGINVGVIKEDSEYVKSYLSEYNFIYKEYNSFADIKSDGNTNYMIVPLYKYMSDILSSEYSILYHIEGLHSHYVLDINNIDDTFKEINRKFFNKWEENIDSSINKHFIDIYYDENNYSELEIDSIIGDDLIIGYIDNLPFEGKINNKFTGLTNEYLSIFADMTGATYKYIKYNTIGELTEALNEKQVDMVLNYYNINNANYVKTNSLGNISYVILTDKDNHTAIQNINSVKDDSVKMINNTTLFSYIRGLGINATIYDNYNDLVKDLNKNDIIIMEKSSYEFYRNKELKDFYVDYLGVTNNGNTFLLINDNKVLNSMFGFFVSTIGTEKINNMALSNTLNLAETSVIIDFIIRNIVYIVLIIIAVLLFFFKFRRKVTVTKRIKKEDKMMYLDVMTNLKNRNYLNDNLNYWESNKIYPQGVVIIDLKDLSVINDIKGHEEGDKQIKSAANILIKTQRENTEIIRSDGNEFLVYMVGYDEKQVVTYVNKLLKEFKNLPYEYGVSIGYSLINSESTTIDDAINEALIMMRKNKGE